MIKAIQKNSQLLAIFAIVCTLILAVVNELTKDKIAEQTERYLLKTLHSIIEPKRLNNDLYNECSLISDPLLGTAEPQKLYIAKYNNTPTAVAITAIAPDGYSGNIHLLVAINTDNSISGVRTLNHKETPGLGDKIEEKKSPWINSFNNKIVESETDARWAVKKDGGMFDQFTGATITPRAVVNAVKNVSLYFQKNKGALLTNNSNIENTSTNKPCRD